MGHASRPVWYTLTDRAEAALAASPAEKTLARLREDMAVAQEDNPASLRHLLGRIEARLDTIAGMQARLERLLDAVAGTLGITADEAGHLMLPPVPGSPQEAP